MKKILSVLIIAVCVCALFPVTANAAPDPMAVKFQEALNRLDYFYEYDYNYMIRVATGELTPSDHVDPWKQITASAEEFDAVLHKHFVLTDSDIQALREFGNNNCNFQIRDEQTGEITGEIPFFDEATQTYTLPFFGGFGGDLPPRRYLGYVKSGATYDVYYQNITYAYLEDHLPDGVKEWEYTEGLGNPEVIEMDGIRFTGGPNGYYAVLSYDNFGRKYTVEMNGDVVRIISCVNYTEDQQPDAFDDKEVADEVIYDIPESGVSIPENDCFAGNTTVKVEEIKSGNAMQAVNKAMETVAQKYVAYEFTALKDNAAVQPNGKLAVIFAIPDGYSDKVTVFYLAEDGTLEKLNTTVNAAERTATAELAHFSTYILADENSKPHQHSYEKVVTAPTCTTEGYTTYTCGCGDTYTADKVAAAGHSFGEWQETKAPTYTEEGEEKRECASCDHFETRPIAVLTKPDPQPSDPTEPSTDPTDPSTDPTDPSTDPTEPSVSPTAPGKDPTEPGKDPTEPSTRPTEATPADTETDNRGSDKTGTILLVAAAAILVLGIAAFVVVRKKK